MGGREVIFEGADRKAGYMPKWMGCDGSTSDGAIRIMSGAMHPRLYNVSWKEGFVEDKCSCFTGCFSHPVFYLIFPIPILPSSAFRVPPPQFNPL